MSGSFASSGANSTALSGIGHIIKSLKFDSHSTNDGVSTESPASPFDSDTQGWTSDKTALLGLLIGGSVLFHKWASSSHLHSSKREEYEDEDVFDGDDGEELDDGEYEKLAEKRQTLREGAKKFMKERNLILEDDHSSGYDR